MKKTIRKLAAAVATAAMCCSVVVPVSAKADSCSTHVYIVDSNMNSMQTISAEYYLHTYVSDITIFPDGEVEKEYSECRVQLVRCFYNKECSKCQKIVLNAVSQDKEMHMNCGEEFVYDYQ